jgi:hypothetical protein
MLTSWSGLLHPTEDTVAIVESTWHGIGIMPMKGPPVGQPLMTRPTPSRQNLWNAGWVPPPPVTSSNVT